MSSLLSLSKKSLVNGPMTCKKNNPETAVLTEEETNVAKRPNKKSNAHKEDTDNMVDRKESDAALEEEPML